MCRINQNIVYVNYYPLYSKSSNILVRARENVASEMFNLIGILLSSNKLFCDENVSTFCCQSPTIYDGIPPTCQ